MVFPICAEIMHPHGSPGPDTNLFTMRYISEHSQNLLGTIVQPTLFFFSTTIYLLALTGASVVQCYTNTQMTTLWILFLYRCCRIAGTNYAPAIWILGVLYNFPFSF
uniref:Uncharacterized protein n=1 Tax=Arundo donax TaxID=35708 RepID=A0A0A9EVE1_ARUDO